MHLESKNFRSLLSWSKHVKHALGIGVLWTATAYFIPPQKQELGLQRNEIRPIL